MIGKVRLDWTCHIDAFTGLCSVAMSALMMSCYVYDNVVFVYLSYILYTLIVHAVLVMNMLVRFSFEPGTPRDRMLSATETSVVN